MYILNNIVLNNILLDYILERDIINYLNRPVKVYENNYDYNKLLIFYNKQKLKKKIYKKYKCVCYYIYIILFYMLFCILYINKINTNILINF